MTCCVFEISKIQDALMRFDNLWIAKEQRERGALISIMGHQGPTIQEEGAGKKCVNARSSLRLKHLHKLATWAGKEASIPPLSACFGRLLAAHAEAAGAPLDPFLFPCER